MSEKKQTSSTPFTWPIRVYYEDTDAGGVVYMTKPLDRPDGIPGKTYKIKWPENDHAFYITLKGFPQNELKFTPNPNHRLDPATRFL